MSCLNYHRLILLLLASGFLLLPQFRGLTLAPMEENLTVIPFPLAQSSSWLEAGKENYEAGKLTEAIQQWEEGLKLYQQEGNIIRQISILNYLALAYQELGNLAEGEIYINQSLTLLTEVEQQESLLSAQAWNTKGMIQLRQGNTEGAILTWAKAEAIYGKNGDKTGQWISLINQSQGLQSLGRYRQAKDNLEEIQQELQAQPDSLLKAQGLRSLGISFQSLGQFLDSKAVLEESWEILKPLNQPEETSLIFLSLGNVARDLKQYDVAWKYYQSGLQLTQEPLPQVNLQLNQLKLLVEFEKWQEATAMIPEIEQTFRQLPPSRKTIYARLNLTESLMTMLRAREKMSPSLLPSTLSYSNQMVQHLVTSIQEAQGLQDGRAEAYSLYQLGKLYAEMDKFPEAEALTQKALTLAQLINTPDIKARTASQLAQILQETGKIKDAIAFYELAFQEIQSLRGDLVAISPNLQFDFKESIEPIYREYVGLLLDNNSQENLKKAREVMEALQLAELDNFFRDACLDTHPVTLDEIDVNAGVLYPIILEARLEVILSLPNQPLQHYRHPISKTELEKKLKQFHSSFSPGFPRHLHWQYSQTVYNWLIRPIETELETYNIKTLVLIPDGFFRNIPVSALYDGEQYLIEKYSIALSPGLQLFAQGLTRDDLKMFAGGLTSARQGFQALPGVETEIEQVTTQLTAETLLNQNFTKENFQLAINNQDFPIVHLATHGQFSSNPDDTFLLTWSDRISIQDFDQLFQKRRVGLLSPIELLVLSACQTAQGDNRATLGLAGFALRSGARSTIGSLWPVSDESTSALMIAFYEQLLTQNVTKAEALRQAQLELLANPSYQHPYFWSPFVLVGNWL